MNDLCPCRQMSEEKLNYENCCAPYHKGESYPDTPEKLMRARYSAYVKDKIQFVADTQVDNKDFSIKEAQTWARGSKWRGLEIGTANDDQVEFTAYYQDIQTGKELSHQELSQFKKVKDKWMFQEGNIVTPEVGTIRNQGPKIGRNDPCSCGSGKKFKKCCGH